MGAIGCPETSVNNYHTTLCNISKERRSHQHRGGSLKSQIQNLFSVPQQDKLCISVFWNVKPCISVQLCVCGYTVVLLLFCISVYVTSWDISVGVVTMLRAGRPRNLGSFPGGATNFYVPQSVQTEYGAHPVAYSMDIGGFSPGDETIRRKTHLSQPSNIEVQNVWSYISTLPCALWCAQMHVQSYMSSFHKNVWIQLTLIFTIL